MEIFVFHNVLNPGPLTMSPIHYPFNQKSSLQMWFFIAVSSVKMLFVEQHQHNLQVSVVVLDHHKRLHSRNLTNTVISDIPFTHR